MGNEKAFKDYCSSYTKKSGTKVKAHCKSTYNKKKK